MPNELEFYDSLFKGMSDENSRERIQRDRYERTIIPPPKERAKRKKDQLDEVLGELNEEELEELRMIVRGGIR